MNTGPIYARLSRSELDLYRKLYAQGGPSPETCTATGAGCCRVGHSDEISPVRVDWNDAANREYSETGPGVGPGHPPIERDIADGIRLAYGLCLAGKEVTS